MEIICIGHIMSYIACNVCHILHIYILLVYIICIGHTTTYLAPEVHHILHMYSFSVNYWCINSSTFCNWICFSVPSSFRFVRFVSEYELSPNPISIYVLPFFTSTTANSPPLFWNCFWFISTFLICVMYQCFM